MCEFLKKVLELLLPEGTKPVPHVSEARHQQPAEYLQHLGDAWAPTEIGVYFLK